MPKKRFFSTLNILQIDYRQVGHDINDMLVSCRVDDVKCDVDDFVYFPNVQYGE